MTCCKFPVGDHYPSARVRGVDISPIQPIWVPPNVDFLVDDCEKEWLQHDVDLAHFRFMGAILKDKAKVLSNAFEYGRRISLVLYVLFLTFGNAKQCPKARRLDRTARTGW